MSSNKHAIVYYCNIPGNSDVNSYNFTVFSETPGIDGVPYSGGMTTDCCLPFPENARATEEECGVQHLARVSWENNHVVPNISWHRVHGSEGILSERANSEGSHLLKLDYSETGPLEITVKFSSHVCSKSTVIHYLVEGVLTSVYLRSRTLVIESRDSCIASPENYTIIIATPTKVVNVSFNATVEYDLGDIVSSGTVITVQLVETTSNTIIDERNYTITYPTSTETPMLMPTEPGVMGAVKRNTNSAVKQIAAGVVGGVVGLLVIVAVSVSLAVWLCVRKIS
jgi:hypothetical protein